jgi:hypothetical protein
MKERYKKLQKAESILLNPLISVFKVDRKNATFDYYWETYLMLSNPKLLIIGKDNRFAIESSNVQKLEDMLNILRQFGFVVKHERVCGDVFKVVLPNKNRVAMKLLRNHNSQLLKVA